MLYYSCENCCFRDGKICLRFSKQVTFIIDSKAVIRGTFLNIEKDWTGNKCWVCGNKIDDSLWRQ